MSLLAGGTDQIITNNVFMQGQYVEVGVSQCGCFGTSVTAPAGYHANYGGLGFVADPAKSSLLVGLDLEDQPLLAMRHGAAFSAWLAGDPQRLAGISL